MSRLDYYVSLLANTSRLRAFEAGIRAAVRPGDRVLDLGTGVGTYAFLALRAGAGHVWGVERNRVIRVARSLAVAEGAADRITFVEGEVPGVDLPSGIDVLLFEDFTTSFLEPNTWAFLAEGYRTLAPGARVVPSAARLSLAPVSSPEVWASCLPPGPQGGDTIGVDWTSLRLFAANTPRQRALSPRSLLAPPVHAAPIPLLPLPRAEDLGIAGAWLAPTAGVIHGLALWFDLEVAPGRWLSNQPSPTPEPWRQLFLPIDPPLEVPAGARVEASVRRDGREDGCPEWVAWEIECADDRRRGHEFAGHPMDLGDLGLDPLSDALDPPVAVDPPPSLPETRDGGDEHP